MSDQEIPTQREPRSEWSDDGVPVLTDIVDPTLPGPEPEAEFRPESNPETGGDPLLSFDDNFGVDEAVAIGLGPVGQTRAMPLTAADREALRAALMAEIEAAAERIVAVSVEEVQALLVERVSQRLRDELVGIVDVTLENFELPEDSSKGASD